MIKGKGGRFARTCSASASTTRRSVIVVGPQLKLHQCGLRRRWRSIVQAVHLQQARNAGHRHDIKAASAR